jgi:hypothetical protein
MLRCEAIQFQSLEIGKDERGKKKFLLFFVSLLSKTFLQTGIFLPNQAVVAVKVIKLDEDET